MLRLLRIGTLATSLVVLLGPLMQPVFAQSARDRDWCVNDRTTAEQTITGCTALIDSRRYRGVELARYHFLRSWGFYNNGDYARAVADAEEAARLDPRTARYIERRNTYLHTKLMSENWTRYLTEIQDDQDVANWSGPPLDAQRAADRR